jgi:hypothetical protein
MIIFKNILAWIMPNTKLEATQKYERPNKVL